MLAHPGDFHDPDFQTPVGALDVHKFLPGKEIVLDVVDPIFHFALVARGRWPVGTDEEVVMLRQFPVGFA